MGDELRREEADAIGDREDALVEALRVELAAMRTLMWWSSMGLVVYIPAALGALTFVSTRSDQSAALFLAAWTVKALVAWGRFAADKRYYAAAETVRAAYRELSGCYSTALGAIVESIDGEIARVRGGMS